jgi:hypothetical protein
MGGEAALAGVARPSVVDGDERRADEPRPQHGLVLGAEPAQSCAQEPNHLPLGDRQAKPDQELHDSFAGHLALKMEHQHQAMQMGAATADDPRIERRGQHLAVRRLPALAPIKRRLSFQHQVLNDDLLIALAARARRGLNRQHHGSVDRKPRDARTAPPLRRLILLAIRPICRLVHPRRFERRTRRQMLQPGDLVLQRLVINPQPRNGRAQLLVFRPQTPQFPNQMANQTDQFSRRHAFKRIIQARPHVRLQSTLP